MRIARLLLCLFVSLSIFACASSRPRATPPQPPPAPAEPTYRVISEGATAVAFEAGPPWLITSGQDHAAQLIFQHDKEQNAILVVFIADAPPGSTIEEATATWWGLLLLMPEDLFTITEKTPPVAVSDEESSFTFLGALQDKTPITAHARIVLVSDHASDAWIMVWTMSPTAMASAMDAEAARVIKTLRIDPS